MEAVMEHDVLSDSVRYYVTLIEMAAQTTGPK